MRCGVPFRCAYCELPTDPALERVFVAVVVERNGGLYYSSAEVFHPECYETILIHRPLEGADEKPT